MRMGYPLLLMTLAALSPLAVGSLAIADNSPAKSPAESPAKSPSPTPTPSHPETIYEHIISQGVPKASLDRIVHFVDENRNRSLVFETYTCAGQNPDNLKPCGDDKRTRASQSIKIEDHDYAVVVDMSRSSLDKRFFLINLKTGVVESYLTTHGKGSGETKIPYRFSNKKDSEKTALGLYVTGPTYVGSHGTTLRLYGAERSNDEAYNRDIVVHGAWYAEDGFPDKINPRTHEKYGRLGVSWGCPAVGLNVIKHVIETMKGGAILDIYRKDAMDEAKSGADVNLPRPQD